MSKAVAIHKALLEFCGVDVGHNGRLFLRGLDINHFHPLTRGGKQVIFPSPEYMAAFDAETQLLFELIPEELFMEQSMFREPSEALLSFRSMLNMRLNIVTAMIALHLLMAATGKVVRKNLTAEQLEFFDRVKGVDERTIANFQKILDAMPATRYDTKQFLAIDWSMYRGRVLKEMPYHCSTRVAFPFREQLERVDGAPYGVRIRKKDHEIYSALFDYLLPNHWVSETYDRGSNNTVAPYLDAMMESARAISEPLNAIVQRFHGLMIEDDLILNVEWTAPDHDDLK